MTREQMIEALECPVNTHMGDTCLEPSEAQAIAAELRKTCATCRHFWTYTPDGLARCMNHIALPLPPFDGSGLCHRWQGKAGQ